jgi:hypothetical protein
MNTKMFVFPRWMQSEQNKRAQTMQPGQSSILGQGSPGEIFSHAREGSTLAHCA